MREPLRVVGPDAIRAMATPDLVIPAVRQALIDHARGRVTSPPPGHLSFTDPPGDCHIKFGRAQASDLFVIKVATSFYDNPRRGLASSDGLMLVLSAQTGAPLALLADEGRLTDTRTAAAGALAVEAFMPGGAEVLGVLGAGTQAALQARWICAHCRLASVMIWSRALSSAQRLADELRAAGLNATAVDSPAQVAARSDVLVTCTPSRSPLLQVTELGRVRLIVAMGADTPGKRELESAVIDLADWIVCDDIGNCLDHGEIQGRDIPKARLRTLGDVLDSARPGGAGLTVVDLTGLPAQDIAVGTAIYRRST